MTAEDEERIREIIREELREFARRLGPSVLPHASRYLDQKQRQS